MKKIFILALAMLFCSYISYSLPTVTIGNEEANTGDVVSVPVTMDGFTGIDYAVNGITMFINYDVTQFSNPSFTNINSTLFPGGISEVGNPGVMAYIWSTGGAAVDVPDGTLIFNLQLTYIGTSATELTWNSAQCLFTNDNLDEIVVTYVDGSVSPIVSILPPVLALPINNQINVPTNPNLSWNASAGATSYTLQVSTLSDFSTFVVNESGITNTNFDLNGLDYLTDYYWRANATDGTNISVWSEVWHFTTIQGPTLEPTVTIGSVEATPGDVVVIPVTMDGFTGIDYAVNGITMFINYDITKLSNPSFTNVNTTLFPGGISETGNPGVMAYIWSTGGAAVDVPNGTLIFNLQFTYIGTTQADLTWNIPQCLFTNDNLDEIVVTYVDGSVIPLIEPPLPPVLVSPINETINVSINPTLTWEASANATGYNINVSTDPTFATTIALEETGTSIDVLGLNSQTTYYWRVNAYNASGTSEWSTVWMFTTGQQFTGPTVTIGEVYANTGDVVVIPVQMYNFTGVDYAVNGITMFINYDVTKLSNPSFTDVNSTLFPGGISETGNPGVMAYIWSTGGAAVDVPPGTLIFNLQFTYIGATQADLTWNIPQCLFTNDNLDEIVVTYIDGFVSPSNPPEPPLPPVLVSPIDGSVDMPNPLDFTWQASEGATNYYIEFSTNAEFTEPVWGEWTTETSYNEDFWYYGETYYWRVKASDGILESEWSEVWDVTIVEFGIPLLVSPVNEAIDVEIVPFALLTWEGLEEATAYNIEISTDPTFAISTPYQVVETSLEVTDLDYLTTYYWRVSGYNDYQTGEWSTVWMFTTKNVPVPQVVLVSPVDGATNQDVIVDLVWELAENATNYIIEVSTDPTFATFDQYQTDLTTMQVINLNWETTYYWKVQGQNEVFFGEWSEVWDFTTGETPVPPAPPVLVSPLNETIDIPVDVLTLDWNASIGADYYNIEYATNATFDNAVELETAETSIDIYNLEYLTTYYWRVNATNQNGTGDWSEVWMFTTAPFIPLAPVLIAPADGSIDLPLVVDFSWNASDGADSYYIEFAHNSDFTDPVWGAPVTTTTYQQEFEDYLGTYYWRVKAIAGEFNSVWSEVWSFTTQAEDIPAPVLVAPLNGATGILYTGTDLSWTIELPAIESYYEVATDNNFTNIEFSGWTELTTVFVGELQWETEYFWRVKAKSELMNESDWSEVWSFITQEIPVPEPPVLVSPVNGTIDVPPAVVELTWEEVGDTILYSIELAHDADFTDIGYSVTTVLTEYTFYNIEGLTPHYWRVKATNNLGGTSDWSEVWMFTTSEPNPFIWTINTGNNATVMVPYTATPTINTIPLTDGDWVGAYSPLGFCVGAIEWIVQPPPQTGNGITVWGDNDQTTITDGMVVGQVINYQLYKAETETYYPVNNVAYSQGNGIYAVNGYYVISEMSYTDSYYVPPVLLTSPYDGEVNVAIDPVAEFVWQAADNADMYNFELSTDPSFSYTIALQTAETGIEVPGLEENTVYYWRVNGFNDNYTGEWSEVWSFTTALPCEPPSTQAKNIIFSNVTDNSIKVRWTRGNGEMALVVAYPNGIDATPEQLTGYIANSEYGQGSMIGTGYVVYSGVGDRVTVTGLLGGHLYTFKVYEYNYTECIAYNLNNAANNPRNKSTLPPEPVIIPTTYKTDTGFEAVWTYNGEVDWFELYLYNDEGNLIEIYDVGDATSSFIDELTPATLYYYAVIANYGGSYSFSDVEPVLTLDVEPLTGPMNTVAQIGLLENTIDLTWEKPADAERSLVVAYTSDPTELPLDATEYLFNTDYSLAPALGDGKIVYIGTDNFTTVTGIEQLEHYYFRVYAFNGGVIYLDTYPLNTHNYNTEVYGAADVWNIVLPAPVMLTPDNKWEEGFSTYWTYDVEIDYFELDVNGEIFDLPGDLRDFDVDGLTPNTIYDVKIRAIYSDVVSDWSNIEQIRTLAVEPAQPTNLVFSNITDVSATLTWTKAIDAEKTLVLAHQLGLTGEPVDNFGYPAGNPAYGDDTQMIDGSFIVYNGTGNSFEFTNLIPSGVYYFELYAYNGEGILGDDILNSFNYNVVEPLLGELQTTVAPPTVAPTNVNFPIIGTTQMNVAWTPGDGTYSIVLAKNNSAPFLAPANGESYNANAQYGLGDVIGDAYVVYVGIESNITVTGLTEGTAYYFAVYTFNGIDNGTVYLDIPALGNETTKAPAPEPLGQDRVISFRNSQATQVSLTWILPTSNAGSYRIALVKEGAALDINDFPIDGMTYTANSTFGLGDQIGSAYVIYNAAPVPTIPNPLTVTGLNTGTTYHFRVFAYNSTEPGTENYNLNSAVFNPREKVAGSREAVAGDEYDGYEGNSLFNLSSIAPNPVKDVINFNMNVYDALPMSIEVYNSDGVRVLTVQEGTTMSIGEHSFSIPTGNISAGLYILKVSTGSSEFAIQSFIVMP